MNSIEKDKAVVLKSLRDFYSNNLYKQQRLGIVSFKPIEFMERINIFGNALYRGYILQVNYEMYAGDLWCAFFDGTTKTWHFQHIAEVK